MAGAARGGTQPRPQRRRVSDSEIPTFLWVSRVTRWGRKEVPGQACNYLPSIVSITTTASKQENSKGASQRGGDSLQLSYPGADHTLLTRFLPWDLSRPSLEMFASNCGRPHRRIRRQPKRNRGRPTPPSSSSSSDVSSSPPPPPPPRFLLRSSPVARAAWMLSPVATPLPFCSPRGDLICSSKLLQSRFNAPKRSPLFVPFFSLSRAPDQSLGSVQSPTPFASFFRSLFGDPHETLMDCTPFVASPFSCCARLTFRS